MNLSNESKLEILSEAIARMATIGFRLEEILDGIKLYKENKSTLDISLYEEIDAMFVQAIAAYEEQLGKYHRLFSDLKEYLK